MRLNTMINRISFALTAVFFVFPAAVSAQALLAPLQDRVSTIRLVETVLLSQPLPQIDYKVSITGEAGVIIDCQGQQGFRVVAGGHLVLSGVTMRGCHDAEEGGAIFVDGGALTVSDSRFDANKAQLGGGVFARNGVVKLTSVLFTGNEAVEHGGGLYLADSDAQLDSVQWLDNVAGFTGGGLSNWRGKLFIRSSIFKTNRAEVAGALANVGGQVDVVGPDTEFAGNTSKYYGGAVQNEGADATLRMNDIKARENASAAGGFLFSKEGETDIRESLIAANRALAAEGGAIAQRGGRVHLTTVELRANRAGGAGGAIASSGRLMLLAGSVLADNVAATNGGAVVSARNDYAAGMTMHDTLVINNEAGLRGGGLQTASNANIRDSAFIGNRAIQGAGIRTDLVSHPARVSIINTTVSDNHARRGGGIYAVSRGEDTLVEIIGSTIAFNSGVEAGEALYLDAPRCSIGNTVVYTPGVTTDTQLVLGRCNSAGGNVFGFVGALELHETDQAGTPEAPIEPGLGERQADDNGTLYYPILPGSPLIDAGRNEIAVKRSGQALEHDQRGPEFARIVNGTVDTGAIELQSGG